MLGVSMKYRDVDYSVAEDREPPYLWRYTIFSKSAPGGAPPRISFGHSTHADAETACKTEIDRSLSGGKVAKRA
jgi:hypothetical protein